MKVEKLNIITKSLIISFFTIIGICGCSDLDKNTSKSIQSMPTMSVNGYKVKRENIPVNLTYPAKIKSVAQIDIVARVDGVLEKKYFKDGDFVKEGDLLYSIDSLRYKALLDETIAQVDVQKANFQEAKDNWVRATNLFKTNAISAKEKDAAVTAYTTAKANLDLSEATLKKAKIDLGYTQIKATISGKTSISNQDIGNYVGSSDNNRKLITITQTDPIYVEFSLPDIELLKNRYSFENANWNNIQDAKLPVYLEKSNGEKYAEVGILDFLDNFVDNETSTIKARATFTNKDNNLIPGLFARVSIGGLIYKNAITVPQKAVLQDALGSYVYVVKNGVSEKKDIKVGDTYSDKYIVSGLENNEIVITDNLTKLRSSVAVNITEIEE
ncbi:efflux RND transporter periplasmic adaptor subunit [Aliarcobacter butzleri]|uniref:efflux RND transporter periplasmic adaptor subunit n=1 Tax=Aliarcobacter butzleri TaxID=28197 RepID=UPI0034501DC9